MAECLGGCGLVVADRCTGRGARAVRHPSTRRRERKPDSRCDQLQSIHASGVRRGLGLWADPCRPRREHFRWRDGLSWPAALSLKTLVLTLETLGPDRSFSMLNIELKIAQEISAAPAQVKAAVALLDGGATVPFIARYRKEVTGGLDDTQLRTLAERLCYLRELDARREAVLASIDEQGKLGDELKQQILD